VELTKEVAVRTTARKRSLALATTLVLSIACAASADTYLVRPDGLGDYETIQAAVDAVADGDVIELADGTFRGVGNRDILVPARPITIRSVSGNFLLCLIDCEGSARAEHRGFHFTTDVGAGNVSLEGIGVMTGYVTDGGAGIWIDGANTIMSDCAVVSCTVGDPVGMGGGLLVSGGGAPNVLSCIFSLNTAAYGGGVAIDQAWGTFNYCEMVDNTATDAGGGLYIDADGPFQIGFSGIVSNQAPRGAGVVMAGYTPYLQHCEISRNDATAGHAGGVLLQGGFINHSTLVENSATEGAGGIHCDAGGVSVDTSIIAFSESGYGVGATEGNAPVLECCDVYGNPAGDYDSVVGDQTGVDFNISQDPQLCGLTVGDYRLYETSPCLYENSLCGEQIGRYGQGCDSPVEEGSWGRLKSLYR
jgi:hypothetical protein